MRLAWVWLVIAAGCGNRAQPPAPEITPPTVAEAEAFAKQFAIHISPCSPREISMASRWSRVHSPAGRWIRRRRAVRRGLVQALGRSMCEIANPANALGGVSPNYSVLRTRIVDGHPLRLVSDNGVTYHELTLDKQPGGIRIADMLMYSTGETFSEMVGSMLDAIEHPSQATAMGRAKQALAEGKGEEARTTIRTLPEALRKTKTIMLFEVFATAAMEDDAEYIKAVDAFGAAFPNDPALELVQIDQAFLRKHFKKVLDLLDRLDKRVGGDPYLDAQRAASYIELGDPAKAMTHAKRATERAPELEQTWWSLLSVGAAAKQYKPALEALARLRDKFSLTVDAEALRADPRFVDLVREFAAWAKAP